jgi:hypothetical protein
LFTIALPRRSCRMQGLSPEHMDDSQPLPTSTPEGSPHQSEVPVVTPPYVDTSEVPVVTTPQVESTESLQPPSNQSRSSHYGQTAYGPTSLPTGLPPQSHQYPQVNRQFPFFATLDFSDLSRILNDPIRHSPQWPVIPAKLPSDIPKFDGKAGEDPNNHVMTFHLWCSSNSLMDDPIRLRLFQ